MRAKKEINVQIGTQIRIARERSNMTQEELSERLTCSPQSISDMERGVVGVSITMLKNLCLVLGVSSDYLLFGAKPSHDLSALADKCRALSDEQFSKLLEIAEAYIEALNLK